jgi:hypothetical protein
VISVLPYLDRILTELRQFLELGTVTTIIVRAATKYSRVPRMISYRAVGCSGLGSGILAAFGAGGAKDKIF